jgi:superfamily I DNA and/or RNA helicase
LLKSGGVAHWHLEVGGAAVRRWRRAIQNSSPVFRQQVLLVRARLRAAGLGAVSVGQSHSLQGAQRPCVIVSTVIARNHGERLLEVRPRRAAAMAAAARAASAADDEPEPVGLFNDARALNVALTRAMSLTVVVGHPATWLREPRFAEMVRTAVDHGNVRGFRGASLPPGLAPRGAGPGALF